MTPEVTPVTVNPELPDQLQAVEALTNTLVERVSTAALDRLTVWGIVVAIVGAILAAIAFFLLWHSYPQQRAQIKASALKELQVAEDQVDLRLEKARETPQITDDLGYASVKLFFDRLEAIVAALPAPQPPEAGAMQGIGSGLDNAQG